MTVLEYIQLREFMDGWNDGDGWRDRLAADLSPAPPRQGRVRVGVSPQVPALVDPGASSPPTLHEFCVTLVDRLDECWRAQLELADRFLSAPDLRPPGGDASERQHVVSVTHWVEDDLPANRFAVRYDVELLQDLVEVA